MWVLARFRIGERVRSSSTMMDMNRRGDKEEAEGSTAVRRRGSVLIEDR